MAGPLRRVRNPVRQFQRIGQETLQPEAVHLREMELMLMKRAPD